MSEVWRLSATELATRIRGREISASEAAEAALSRLDQVNPAINAVVDHDPEQVLRYAREIDARLAEGERLGPLAGVPITVKVNVDQQGFATTNGVKLQRELIAEQDNPVVANLKRAGAVIVGRTNTPAFSYRWFTDNLLHGATLNPRDPSLTPGGSSGGAAAAVTAGIGHLAHGTDIAGSIRYPAAACGVHGLRPSLGRVPAFNASSPERGIGPQLMAVSGPLARSVADLRLGLEAMASFDPRDPWWVPAPLTGPQVEKRVALCTHPDGMETAQVLVDALERAGAILTESGWQVERLERLPPLEEAARLQVKLWMGDGFEAMWRAAERENDPGALAALDGQHKMAETLTLPDFSAALTRRASLIREWQLFLVRYPVVLLPNGAEPAFPNQLDLSGEEGYRRVWKSQMPQIGIPLLGLPALSLTTGLEGSVPVGVQLLSSRFREDLCLAAAEAIEAAGVPTAPIDPLV